LPQAPHFITPCTGRNQKPAAFQAPKTLKQYGINPGCKLKQRFRHGEHEVPKDLGIVLSGATQQR
jgi:hypothetical protein